MSSSTPKSLSRRLSTAAGFVLAGGIAAAAGVAIAAVRLAKKTVTPAHEVDEPVQVLSIAQVDERLVVQLEGPEVSLPGQYSLLFDGRAGHARLGRVLTQTGNIVTREVVAVDRGRLRAGARGYINGWWYSSPESLGLRVERTTIALEGGEAEAWIVHPRRARRHHWAVHVHGRGGLPAETLRGVPSLARLGITSLIISYRNDPNAPAGRSGRYGLGLSEARDVDAGIAEAVRRGAERVTLCGWSMGGTACLTAAVESEHRNLIDGLVLDSPAVDWDGLLHYQAGLLSVPEPITRLGISLLRSGSVAGGEPQGINFSKLTPQYFAQTLRVPVLIHASRGDTFVPSAGAESLARQRPDLVQLRLTERGEHVRIWNTDPEAWEAATELFMRHLPRPAWRG